VVSETLLYRELPKLAITSSGNCQLNGTMVPVCCGRVSLWQNAVTTSPRTLVARRLVCRTKAVRRLRSEIGIRVIANSAGSGGRAVTLTQPIFKRKKGSRPWLSTQPPSRETVPLIILKLLWIEKNGKHIHITLNCRMRVSFCSE
jgi:hypothetical protein